MRRCLIELWIRSQDSELLEKVDGITLDRKGIEIYSTRTGRIFGIYSSKERALEVLDEIQEYMIKCSFAKITNGLGEDIDLIPNHIFIYQMPEE